MGNHNIPAAVRKQDEAAEAALTALEAARSQEALGDVPAAADEPGQPPSAATRDTLLDDANQPAPLAAVALDAPGAPEPKTKPGEGETVSKADYDKLNSRLAVLLGKYNSEVPRLSERVKELERENDELLGRLEQAAQAPATLSPEAYKKYLTPEEQADLDENYAAIQVKMARGIAEAIVEARDKVTGNQVKELKQTVEKLRESQAQVTQTRFWKDVDALAPGAAAANASDDPEWVAFLGGTDRTSRLTYREIGIAAVNRGDAEGVANLFNLFKESSVGVDPEAARKRVLAQVKPGTAPSAPRTQPRPAGPVINESDIRRFYQNAASSRMTDAQIAAKEAEFDLAASEGRIRFGK